MSYSIRHQPRFAKKLLKLDPQVARRILRDLHALETLENPALRCKPLRGPLKGLWRYHAGDYQVILDIHDDELLIIALDADHRSTIYDD